MIRYLITFAKQVMEARVMRLDLLKHQAERKSEFNQCTEILSCCTESEYESDSDTKLTYYIHK